MGWRVGGLYGTPRPVRLELDPFTSSSCRQTRVREQLSSEEPWFCMAGKQELLWAVAALVLK